MSTQTLQLPPGAELEVETEVAELVWDYGDGYDAGAFVGHTSGWKHYRFTYIAPNRTTHQISNPESMSTQTYAVYFLDFWLRRKIDGEAFYVTDPITGGTVTVKFVGKSVPLKSITRSVFRIDAAFRQHRTA